MSKNNSITTLKLARAGVISGLYIVISLFLAPISSGPIQVRISESLTILALIFPESIVALFVGCALSNLITGCAVYDIIFGSLITLIAGILTYFSGKLIKNTLLKIVVGGIFPIILNALFLPLIWQWCYGFLDYVYIVQVGILVIGQALSVYLIGTPIYLIIIKLQKRNIKFLLNDNLTE